MIASVVQVLAAIATIVEAHPGLAKKLAEEVRDMLDGHEDATLHSLEAQRALAAGIAAACSNAVQAAMRKQSLPI